MDKTDLKEPLYDVREGCRKARLYRYGDSVCPETPQYSLRRYHLKELPPAPPPPHTHPPFNHKYIIPYPHPPFKKPIYTSYPTTTIYHWRDLPQV